METWKHPGHWSGRDKWRFLKPIVYLLRWLCTIIVENRATYARMKDKTLSSSIIDSMVAGPLPTQLYWCALGIITTWLGNATSEDFGLRCISTGYPIFHTIPPDGKTIHRPNPDQRLLVQSGFITIVSRQSQLNGSLEVPQLLPNKAPLLYYFPRVSLIIIIQLISCAARRVSQSIASNLKWVSIAN